jgi:hypothetical protein
LLVSPAMKLAAPVREETDMDGPPPYAMSHRAALAGLVL